MKISVLTIVFILNLVHAAAAAPEFKVSAIGGNSCGFWGSGFSRMDSHPVSDQQSYYDNNRNTTYRYMASSGCGQLFLHTEIDWACNCGSLCAENGGLASFHLDDVVFTGPPGATTAYFRINLDLTVPETTGLGNNWRLYAYAVAFNQALIDTGDQSGPLPTTRLVSSMGSWSVNQPVHFYVALTTGIRAADQAPNARGEASVAFPFDMLVFSFFDASGNPVEGFSAHSAGFTCPRGDMDCDQTVTPADIPAFASALLNPVSVGFCESPDPDMNADGSIDGRDIEPFIVCVLGGGCP